MNDISVKETVARLMEEIEKRNRRIQEKVDDLRSEAAAMKSKLDIKMKLMVDCDLSGENKEAQKIDKELQVLKAHYGDMQTKVVAYSHSLNDHVYIRPELKNIFEIIDSAQKEWNAQLQVNNNELEEIQANIILLQEKANDLKLNDQVLRHNQDVEKNSILKILPLIESRPVENPWSYLMAFSQGADIEPYITQQKVPWTLPEQARPVYSEEFHEPSKSTIQGVSSLEINKSITRENHFFKEA